MTGYETFDWLAFCDRNHVPYVERGPNVARGHVNIRCPFCGEADPSEHLGLHMSSSAWGCWRDSSHRGKKPHRLIQALLGISFREADALVREHSTQITRSVDELQEMLRSIDRNDRVMGDRIHSRTAKKSENVAPPKGTFRVGLHPEQAAPAIEYLRHKRGFTRSMKRLVSRYDPRWGVQGDFRGRVLFPVRHGGVNRGWIGRAVGKSAYRYKAFPSGEGLRDWIYNYDFAFRATGPRHLAPPKTLVITEGIFDALKIDLYGKADGVRAVALLGLSLSPSKLTSLIALCRRYPNVRICLDRGAEAQAIALERSLVLCRARCLWLPGEVKDPGEMHPSDVRKLAQTASKTLPSPLVTGG